MIEMDDLRWTGLFGTYAADIGICSDDIDDDNCVAVVNDQLGPMLVERKDGKHMLICCSMEQYESFVEWWNREAS